ncbi:Ceramide glucosyltransferase [Rasamsonia emersonii CBS 393.64]|uniref:Ceramide glucosyltransferase n=1 Tax=Rasamsonia emersonii (strain ATCC 16479 / CBS 393.64 / IMI 116815) TaxID=1408163 RepID=A0A0F4YVE6_RASE3|nr:Ceramide glucosyltransferase [Rasamsonia emersonii CBS 393.64]KKA21816.1 Ceramide glucosyltransferase [Rasamsonia emersonii CBS 393.64]
MLGVQLSSSSSVVVQRGAAAAGSSSVQTPSWLVNTLGWAALVWYLTVVAVCALGYFQITPSRSVSSTSPDAPHVTVIRPVKGLEPYLYECLASTLRQDYPRDKLTTYICVSTRKDPSFPTLEKLLADFPDSDVRIFVEEEDPLLQDNGGYSCLLGPNPKIRNMSRAYREAKGDIVWIIDCNVWVGRGVCGRMVDRLCGVGQSDGKKYKFVHHLPIAVNVDEDGLGEEGRSLLNGDATRTPSIVGTKEGSLTSLLRDGGGRLEELFLSSSHAKMYTAINTVLLAPCIVGKSNMFRRSQLNYLTRPSPDNPRARHPGIDYFSDNICEDHLIGDLLWKKQIREEKELGERWGKHAMVFGDLAIQPVANMSVKAYIARRVRWLRVRKFTVLLATLVEPGTESLVCSLYGAFGVTTALAGLLQNHGSVWGSYLSTWNAFFTFWTLSIVIWAAFDWTQYLKLHSAATVEIDEHTAPFARPIPKDRTARRPFLHWLATWIGREVLAFPIWAWAVYGGTTVVWRDRSFKVSFDAKAREVDVSAPVRLRRGVVADSSYSSGVVPGSSGSTATTTRKDDRNKIRQD